MAAKKEGLELDQGGRRWAGLGGFPFPGGPPRRPALSAIEDDTPLGDLLSSENAAPPGPTEGKADRERADLKVLAAATFGAAVRSTPALIAIVAVLGLVLALIVTGIIVSSPPKAVRAAAPLTSKGEALVRTWLLPPGDPLEPKMEMERGLPGEGPTHTYSAEDAAKLGIKHDLLLEASLRDKNDEAIGDLFGTVP